MPLFIANTTRQHATIQVRLAETGRVLLINIPSGSQWEAGRDISESQMQQIVTHLERFGGMNVTRVKSQKVKRFSGFAYSDRKINIDSIMAGNEVVLDEAQNRSVETATVAALANDIVINDSSRGAKKRLAKVTAIEVVEEPQKGQPPSGKEMRMSLEVTPQGRDDNRMAI